MHLCQDGPQHFNRFLPEGDILERSHAEQDHHEPTDGEQNTVEQGYLNADEWEQISVQREHSSEGDPKRPGSARTESVLLPLPINWTRLYRTDVRTVNSSRVYSSPSTTICDRSDDARVSASDHNVNTHGVYLERPRLYTTESSFDKDSSVGSSPPFGAAKRDSIPPCYETLEKSRYAGDDTQNLYVQRSSNTTCWSFDREVS